MPHGTRLIEQELSALLEIECDAREFVAHIEATDTAARLRGSIFPPFSPETLEYVRKLKGHFGELDDVRTSKAEAA